MQELTLLRDQNKQLVRLEGDQKAKIPRLTSQLQKARKTAEDIHLPTYPKYIVPHAEYGWSWSNLNSSVPN